MPRIFRPLSDNILINPIPLEQTTQSGILYLYNEPHKVQKGVVVAMGPGIKGLPREVRVDDLVLFPVNSGLKMKLNDHEYIVISEQQLIAVL